MFDIAESAMASDMMLRLLLIMTSVLWKSASKPWYAVYRGGTVVM